MPGTESLASALRLLDGRSVSYRIYGRPGGRPVLSFHGTPGSHLKFAIANETAAELGLALIAVDRWGYGDTDEPEAFTLAQYAADIAQVADQLGVGRFAVLGISGGGPYAAAVAAELGGRVSAAALVAPVGPIFGSRPRPTLDAMHRLSFEVLPRIPGAIAVAFAAFRQVAKRQPTWAARVAGGRSLPADRAILGDRDFAVTLGQSFAVGMVHGTRGPVIDMQLFSCAWGVELAATQCPTQIWIGDQDRNVPLSAVEALADQIPSAALIRLGPHGHYWIARNHGQVLRWLVETHQ